MVAPRRQSDAGPTVATPELRRARRMVAAALFAPTVVRPVFVARWKAWLVATWTLVVLWCWLAAVMRGG